MIDLDAVRVVVLLAHGSSRQQWNQHILKLVDQLNSFSPQVCYFACFLEQAQPELSMLVTQLVDQKCTSFDLLPLFLAPGQHVLKDIPTLVDVVQKQFSVQIRLQPWLGSSSDFSLFIHNMLVEDLS